MPGPAASARLDEATRHHVPSHGCLASPPMSPRSRESGYQEPSSETLLSWPSKLLAPVMCNRETPGTGLPWTGMSFHETGDHVPRGVRSRSAAPEGRPRVVPGAERVDGAPGREAVARDGPRFSTCLEHADRRWSAG